MSSILFSAIVVFLLEAFNRIAYRMQIQTRIGRLLGSFTLFWAWIVLVSWLLSLGYFLTATAFGFTAIITVGVCFVFVIRPPALFIEQIRDLLKDVWWSFHENKVNFVLIAIIILWLVNASFRALLFPPVTWDSLTYHLPMVASWLQNGYVGYYETTAMRQVISPPNAEILQMFHVIFFGNDDLVQFTQLESFIVALLGVYYISRSVGLSRTMSLSASAVTLTVPLALLQSYSTQNDLAVVAGIVLCLVWLTKYVIYQKRSALVLLAISLGLLLGIKFHMLIAVPILMIVTIVVILLQTPVNARVRAILFFMTLFLMCTIVLGGEVYISNLKHYGQLIPKLGPLDNRPSGFEVFIINLQCFKGLWLTSCWDFFSDATWDHNISHFGPLFGYFVLPLSIAGGIVLLWQIIKKRGATASDIILLSILISLIGTFVCFSYVHRQRPYDLRYLLFLPIGLSTVALWMMNQITPRFEKILPWFLGCVALVTVAFTVISDNSPYVGDIIAREPSERITSNLPSMSPEIEIFRMLDDQAKAGESIIFSGMEDDWSYTLFGHNLSRRVYYVDSLQSFISHLNDHLIQWIVVRDYDLNQPIMDYIKRQPYKFQLLKTAHDTSGNYFFTDLDLYKVRTDFKNPTRYEGIYADNVTGGEIVLGSDVPGKFILRCLIDPYYKEKLTMKVVAPGDSIRYLKMAPSGPLTIELSLKHAGDIHCYLSETYVPKELGQNEDTRKLGVVVEGVDFEYNPVTVIKTTVQVFPKQM